MNVIVFLIALLYIQQLLMGPGGTKMRPLDLFFECYILFHMNVFSFVALNSAPPRFIMKLVGFFQLGF